MSGDRKTAERLDDELLTAYVDGVAELAPDERQRIEARLASDPDARADQAAVRSLLDQLRAMPPEGTEPDWAAMERSIRQAVGHEVPRPWWRNWRWLAPLATCASAALAVLVLWPRPELIERTQPAPFVERTTPPEDTMALWLDGNEVEVDLSAADLLGGDDLFSGDNDEVEEVGLLPTDNLGWVDRLDDDAVARAERWFADRSSAPAEAPRPPLAPGRKG